MYGIFTYIYHKNPLNVGIYIPYMDPMGITIVFKLFAFQSFLIHLWDTQIHSHILRVQSPFMTLWQWCWKPERLMNCDITRERFGISMVSWEMYRNNSDG